MRRLLWMAAVVVAAPSGLLADEGAAPEPTPGLTTDVWEPAEPPLDLHWYVLAVPEVLVEAAFAPAAFLLQIVESRRLDKTIYQALRNESGTVVFKPKGKVSFGDGFGVGGTLSLRGFSTGDAEIDLGVLGRLNGDYELDFEYTRTIPWLEGRQLDFVVQWEVDKDERWYGIGNDTDVEDERGLRSDALTALLALDLRGQGLQDLNGRVVVGYRRETLGAGERTGVLGVGELMDDEVGVPPGFGRTLDFPEVDLVVALDSRDTEGRPTKGMLTTFATGFTSDVNGADLRAISGAMQIESHHLVLPRNRVLLGRAGVAASLPVGPDAAIPVHRLVTLGRRQHLRGYDSKRFRDRYGWWVGGEYRWPIYEYKQTGVVLANILFVDVGRVAGTVEEIFEGPVRYSGGVGLRVAHETRMVLQADLGLSPEGFELAIGLGTDL
jgi:outer membrane protein assembly factor BamA